MEDKIEFSMDVINQLLLAAIIIGQINPEAQPKELLADFVIRLNELEVESEN